MRFNLTDEHLTNPEEYFLWDKLFVIHEDGEVIGAVIANNATFAWESLEVHDKLTQFQIEEPINLKDANKLLEDIHEINGKWFDLEPLNIEEFPKPAFSIVALINHSKGQDLEKSSGY